jgi:putative membrane protein
MSNRTRTHFVASILMLGAVSCGGPTANDRAAAPSAANQTSPDSPGLAEATNPDNLLDGSNRGAKLTDPQIAAITDSVNSAEIEQAQIAQQKSSNEQVRRFAAMMIEHHGQAKTQQAALKLDPAESPLSRELAQQSRATLETLKAKQGADFDRAYLQAQVEGHQKALDAIENDLRPSAQSADLKSYLEKLTPQVQQHLEQARSAQQSLATGGDTAPSSTTSSR